MAVMIDIPGIGQVEAKNAASEATLRAILQAIQAGGGRGAGGRPSGGAPASPGGGGAGGGAGGGSQSVSGKAASFASKMAATAASQFGKSAGYAGQMADQAGKMIGGVGNTVGFFGKGAITATKAVGNLAIAGANLASELANVGDSLTSAARSLNAIPVIGGVVSAVFGAIAAAAESVTGSMKDASAGGATFGGSMAELSRSSSQAGMTMKDFAAMVKENGPALGAFGATTESGAKNFAKLSGQLRASGSDLYALGFGTKEINQGLANYGKLLKHQGLQGTQSNAQLVDGSKKYLKEMDLLAKITGETRADKEKEREALVVDQQLAAAMVGINKDVAASAHNLIQSMPKGAMRDFAKDMIANGTATTDANKLLMSQYPGLAAQLTSMHSSTQKNVKITDDQTKSALTMGKAESQNLKNTKTAVAANTAELGVLTDAYVGFNNVNLDAIDAAKAEQAAAEKGTDGQMESIEKLKSSLAALTNNILLQLSSSGGLGMMMSMFESLAGFVIGVVIPGLQMLIPILGKIWNGMTMLLEPIIESVSKSFGGMGDTLKAVDNILNWVFDTLNGVVRGGIIIFESILRAFDTLTGPFNRLSDTIFGVEESTGSFGDTLIDIGAAVGTALELLADIIGWTIDNAVIPLVKMFQAYVLPVLDSVYQTIKEYLVPILVAAGVLFLAFNAMTILGTVVKFAYIAAMVVATAGLAIMAAGVAIVAGALFLLTSPIGLAILAIGALIIIFKKAGGDFQVITDGLKYLWSGLQTFFSALKLGFFKVLDALPGVDFGKEIEEEEKKIVEQKAEREQLVTAMSTRMEENKAKAAADAKKEEGKQTTGLMDDLKGLFGPKGAANAAAAERHKDEKRAQNINFRNNQPGKFGGGGGAGGGAGGKDSKAEPGKPDIKVDHNAGPEALLKQFAEKQGSPLAGAEAQKQAIVAQAEKKTQQEAANEANEAIKKKQEEDAKKKADEDAKKKKEEEEKNKKPESAETLLAQLNTSMTKLLAHAEQTTKNTYATYDAAKGLNKNLYKA
jgi:FlaG/FlaF family flagellin (archaellin)